MNALVCENCQTAHPTPTVARPGDPCPHCGQEFRGYRRHERLDLDVDMDLSEVLEPKPNEDQHHHQQFWSESDLRLVGRALRGEPPVDDDEREARRIVLNGIVYTLSGEQEVPVDG